MRTPPVFVCTLSALVSIYSAQGNPLGGTVVPGSGAASISSSPGILTINQTTPKVIINWQDFSIGAGEVTRFVQPSANAAVLNRVTTDNPSAIYGTLEGNGSVYLINPNGILVGRSGQINVGSFLGSTLDLGADEQSANASFLSGAGLTLSGNSTAAVRNEGYISALDDVFLVAHTVQNAGTISGHTVGLAAGADIELRQAGTERISVVAGNSTAKPGTTDGVVNSGNITAVSAELKAAGGNIYALAINNGGAIRATGIVKENGRILLRSDRGTVVNSGTLDASSKAAGAKGGDVKVFGERVGLVGNSKIDVSGDGGGGTVLVGGDLQGKNASVPNAQRTVVGKDATINADALSSGNGGKVIVWSDEATRYLGSISAKGAGNKGNGGFVEVSGKSSLAFDGAVNVAAGRGGAKGTVLLDPATITVQAAGPDINGNGTAGDDIAALTDLDNAAGDFGGADSIITATAVNALLTGNNNLVLAATVSTTVNAAINGSDDASLTLNAPTVNLNAPISLSGAGILSGTPTIVNVGMGGRIQNGVDVAAVNGTVNVAAGSYAENISVAKGLTLRGAKAGVNATTRDTSSGESIIRGEVRLEAPNITLDGFTVRESAAGAGIVANNAAGDRILNNYITDNVFGLSLASDGSRQILVQNNFFENNVRAGGASGNGIYTDFTVSDVRVNANRFVGQPEGSVTFLGTAASTISDIEISDNIITGDGPISIGNISDVTIRRNAVTGNSGHGIWVGGGATMVSITENLVQNNMGAGLKFARPGSSGILAGSSGFDVSGNAFSGNADGAVVIDTSEGSRYAGVLNASGNWWGNATGPNYASIGFTGGGDLIVAEATGDDVVDFGPWLNSGNDLAAGTAGFQGDFSVLNVSPLSPKASLAGFIDEALGLLAGSGRRLQLFAGTYDDQAIIDVPNTAAVILKGNVTLNAATSISFGSTVDTDGSAWTLDAITPSLTLGGAVGNAAANSELGSLTASASATIGGSVVKTRASGPATGNQTYTGPVTLAADTTLTGSTITFENTVNGTSVGGESLAINGNAVFGTAPGTFVGDLVALQFLDVSGMTTLNAGNLGTPTVRTTGAQDYRGAVTLGLDTTLSGSIINFGSTVNGVTAGTESLNIIGNAVFGGLVGNIRGLQFVDVTGTAALNGGTVTTSGAQEYDGAVTLGADTTLSGSTVTFGSTVNGAADGNESLSVVGNATFAGAVGNTRSLEFVDVTGQAAINGGSVTTAGVQDYDGAVTLGADATLNNTTVTFGSTVNAGGNDLTLNSSGAVTLNGPSISNLRRLRTLAGGSTTLNGGALNATTLIDIGDQLLLGADTILTAPAVTLAEVTGNANDLDLRASGATTLNGAISGVGSLTTDAPGNTVINQTVNAVSVALNDLAALNGGTITTSADQNYNAAVTLGADTTLSGVNVTLVGVTGAGRDLRVNGSAVTTLNGAVNGVDALSTDAPGSTVINQAVSAGSVTLNDVAALNGATVVTTADQNYNAAVTLGVDTVLSGVNVTLADVTGGGRDLQVNGSGLTTFNGAVTGVDALTTDAVGNTVINQAVSAGSVTLNDLASLNGGTITTIGDQSYNAAATLGADTTLSGVNVTLSGITGAGRDLSANASGATTFNGVVAGVDALSTDAGGNTVINQTVSAGSVTLNDAAALNGGVVSTVGGQTYNADVTLGANTVLNNMTVAFGGTVNGGGNDLTLNSSGDVTLSGPAIVNVGALRTTGPGSTTLNGGFLNANTLIDIGDELLLGDGTTLTSLDVALANVTGLGNDLMINASGATTFAGAITDVGNLTTDGAGTTAINTDTIATFGSQNYNDAVTLGADATLSGANISFNSTLGGAGENLSANSDGTTLFGGTVAGIGALVTDGGGDTVFNNVVNAGSVTLNDAAALNGGSVITDGNQTYNSAVTLGLNTTLTANNVSLRSVLAGGGNDLDVDALGTISFGGNINGINTLTLAAGGDIDSLAVDLNNLFFTTSGRATFLGSGNEIVNALANCAFWSADGGFLVSDALSGKVFSGTAAGTCIDIDNDEAVERIISQLVPQVQFDEIQTESVEISGERLQKAGILTRSSELFVKPGEALTRSGEVKTEN